MAAGAKAFGTSWMDSWLHHAPATFSLPAGLDDKQRAGLQRAAETCPVKVSLEGAIPMELHWS